MVCDQWRENLPSKADFRQNFMLPDIAYKLTIICSRPMFDILRKVMEILNPNWEFS